MIENQNWKPSTTIINLLKRAVILTKIRHFFANRGVLEVETPILSQATVTDVNLCPFQTLLMMPGGEKSITLYMITSPEYHMKRLLAAGSGSIYQLGRSFRNEENGRYHNPEFTMLEWYRPHYDMHQLMDEVNDLLQQVLDCASAEKLSYQKLFLSYLDIDPLSAEKKQLCEVAIKLNLNNLADVKEDHATLLQLLFAIGIEPYIGHDKPVFVYDFPANQSALAKIKTQDHRVAERFEVYFRGIELANGFCELTDVEEQRQRFDQDNLNRIRCGLPQQKIDKNFLDAMKHGIPTCSGVALGIDRLVMLAIGANSLSDVIAFPISRA